MVHKLSNNKIICQPKSPKFIAYFLKYLKITSIENNLVFHRDLKCYKMASKFNIEGNSLISIVECFCFLIYFILLFYLEICLRIVLK
jgi:hypothetical protein